MGVGEETMKGINARAPFVVFLPMEVGTAYIPQEKEDKITRIKDAACHITLYFSRFQLRYN